MTSGTIAATVTKRMAAKPNSTTPVAAPLGHPRFFTIQFTAGSRAKDRNSAVTSQKMRSRSLRTSRKAA